MLTKKASLTMEDTADMNVFAQILNGKYVRQQEKGLMAEMVDAYKHEFLPNGTHIIFRGDLESIKLATIALRRVERDIDPLSTILEGINLATDPMIVCNADRLHNARLSFNGINHEDRFAEEIARLKKEPYLQTKFEEALKGLPGRVL